MIYFAKGQRRIEGAARSKESNKPITQAQVHRSISECNSRRRFLQLMIFTVLVSGNITHPQLPPCLHLGISLRAPNRVNPGQRRVPSIVSPPDLDATVDPPVSSCQHLFLLYNILVTKNRRRHTRNNYSEGPTWQSGPGLSSDCRGYLGRTCPSAKYLTMKYHWYGEGSGDTRQ